MEIIIELSSADVDCFLRHIERRSVLGIMLVNSGFQLQSTGWPTNAIHCNEAACIPIIIHRQRALPRGDKTDPSRAQRRRLTR